MGPESRQQLLPGAEGTEGLGQGGAVGPGRCPAAPGLPLSHPAPLPVLTELSVTPRRMTGREKANLGESTAPASAPTPRLPRGPPLPPPYTPVSDPVSCPGHRRLPSALPFPRPATLSRGSGRPYRCRKRE